MLNIKIYILILMVVIKFIMWINNTELYTALKKLRSCDKSSIPRKVQTLMSKHLARVIFYYLLPQTEIEVST